MVKFFQTANRKATGVEVSHNIREVLVGLFSKAATDKPLIVEYSVAGSQKVVEVAQEFGHTFHGIYKRTQLNGNEFVLIVFNCNFEAPTSKGFDIVKDTIRHFAGVFGRPIVVFDPFSGIGATCDAVLSTGNSYIGHEFNKARMDKAIAKISKKYDR